MTRILISSFALLLAASGASAQSPDELAEARAALEAAAKSPRPSEARRLAAEAMPALLARAESPDATCFELFLLAEAQIRAGLPSDALATEQRSGEIECDLADRLQLRAWALEYNEEGERRGNGAKLRAAEATYLRAADLLAQQAQRDTGRIAGCIGNAAELAQLRGDHRAAFERAVSGIQIAPTADQRELLAHTLLTSGARLHGEGACLDAIAVHLEEDRLLRLTERRLQALRQRLDQGHDDGTALASVAYYAILVGTPGEYFNAKRYLEKALALDDKLPDAWYLLGRVHEAREQIPAAKDAYRRQFELRPDTPASRLAVNALAYLEAQVLTSEETGEELLGRLNAELDRTPTEAPLHETRARLLATLGRQEEACKAASDALSLSKDDEFRATILRFQRAQGCPLGE